jgi:hypothetical protein
MKLLLSALLIMSFAQANLEDTKLETKTKRFNITSFGDFGSRVYYNCDSVEAEVKSMMELFGAQNISVRCSGGISPWGGFATDAFVTLKMDVMTLDDEGTMRAEYEAVELRARRNCHLLKEVTKATAKLFVMKDLKYSRSCSPSSDFFRLSATILK